MSESHEAAIDAMNAHAEAVKEIERLKKERDKLREIIKGLANSPCARIDARYWVRKLKL